MSLLGSNIFLVCVSVCATQVCKCYLLQSGLYTIYTCRSLSLWVHELDIKSFKEIGESRENVLLFCQYGGSAVAATYSKAPGGCCYCYHSFYDQ